MKKRKQYPVAINKFVAFIKRHHDPGNSNKHVDSLIAEFNPYCIGGYHDHPDLVELRKTEKGTSMP